MFSVLPAPDSPVILEGHVDVDDDDDDDDGHVDDDDGHVDEGCLEIGILPNSPTSTGPSCCSSSEHRRRRTRQRDGVEPIQYKSYDLFVIFNRYIFS